MKRIFAAPLFVLVFLAMAIVVPETHAQEIAPRTFSESDLAGPSVDFSGLDVSAEVQAAIDASVDEESDPKMEQGYASVMQWIMKLFAWLVGVAALVLDAAVYFTVVRMGEFVQQIPSIGTVWRILRDLGNIILIFGFLAIGIATILQSETYGNKTKMLPMLLICAVFMNFSLFFAQAVVDVGNLFATQFYTQINGGVPAGNSLYSGTDAIGREGISNKIMAQLGLVNIYNQARSNSNLLKEANSWLVGFMGIILFIITAFVFFSLAFILIARFVVLVFVIVLSPIGIVGLAVPKLSEYAKKWWHQLFEQTITAPVLLLLLYVALKVITDDAFLGTFGLNAASADRAWSGYLDTGVSGVTNFAAVLMPFLIAMGLLLFVTIAAKNLSAAGAGGAMKLAGAASFGATGWALRNTVGRGSNFLAKKSRSSAFARIPLLGTGITKGLEATAKSSFDIRGTSALKSFPGGKIEAGDAQKGGYKGSVEASVKARTEYAKGLKGRDLTDAEKMRQAVLKKDIQASNKKLTLDSKAWVLQDIETKQKLKELDERKAAGSISDAEHDAETSLVNDRMAAAQKNLDGTKQQLKKQNEELDAIESVTDKGAQLKYAQQLAPGDSKSVFNKWINPSANTEAAKKIREEAKKSPKDDLMNKLQKAIKAGEDSEKGGGKKEEAHAAPPPTSGGGGGGAPKGGGPAPH